MLQTLSSQFALNYGQLMQVYGESLSQSGKEDYPHLAENCQILEAEQDFYLYIKSFLKQKENILAVWSVEGEYVSAVRAEPFLDGYLIEGLETSREYRNQGYAKLLLCAFVNYMCDNGIKKLYSHIRKNNAPSLRAHQFCGFQRISDHAVYIDGSADHQCCTYLLCSDP